MRYDPRTDELFHNRPLPQQASISPNSSYGYICQRESAILPFIPPSTTRAEQSQSYLLYPTGDRTSPSGSAVVGQGALDPYPLSAPPQQPTAQGLSIISPTPRKRHTVALGEPIMKPHVCAFSRLGANAT